MRKHYLLLLMGLFVALSCSAITQPGYVKTVARPNLPSQRMDGVVIRVRGSHNAVESRETGDFALLLANLQNGEPYALSSIVKSGYEPAEQELIGKTLPCSDQVPLEILLVNKLALMQEKEAIAAKARTNVERYYSEQLAMLEAQLAVKQIAENDFHLRLQQLEAQYERFEPLVEAISDRFARTDYDRMDSLTLMIQSAIEDGDAAEAERLIRLKGDLDEREAAIARQEQANREAQRVLAEASSQLEQRIRETQRDKRELADDYYRLYSSFLTRFMNDSAAVYIQRRAQLDTTNVDYQLQAGQFMAYILCDYTAARRYYDRAYRICLSDYGEQSGQMATTCHEIGYVLKQQRFLDEALSWYERSLSFREHVRGKESGATAEALNNLGELYRAKKDLKQAMKMHRRALHIRQKLMGAESMEVAESKSNIGGVYYDEGQFTKAEQLYREAYAIYVTQTLGSQRRLADVNNNLGAVCFMQSKYADAVDYFENALSLYRQLFGSAHPATRNAEANLDICKQKQK